MKGFAGWGFSQSTRQRGWEHRGSQSVKNRVKDVGFKVEAFRDTRFRDLGFSQSIRRHGAASASIPGPPVSWFTVWGLGLKDQELRCRV